ncbi:MAG: hypothetical protein KatS3mg081_0954 [Gemmatimonadales bacterium]|nr:N-acetylmuramoyl-L-alanine amidase LytC [bacterium HR33]GIW51599.1 MAG: hypothetical protein KatS3mg081_0954 [Gemmatimonadales bacterium]
MRQARNIGPAVLALVAGLGCGSPVRTFSPIEPSLARGPLTIRVVYPRSGPPVWDGNAWLIRADSGVRIESRDSAFIFGSVGRGDAALWVNGRPVQVHPTGGWIAWLPLPDDTSARFELLAAAGSDTVRAVLEVPLAPRFRPPSSAVWIDTSSLWPRGDRWILPGEPSWLSVTASRDAKLRLITAAGDTVSMIPIGAARDSPPWGEEAFATEPLLAAGQDRGARYVLRWNGPFGPDPGNLFSPAPRPENGDSSWFKVEAILGADTVRARWPLRVGILDRDRPLVAVIDDDPARTGTTDSILPGRPLPYGTYHWFFPTGTLASVSGRWNDQVRLQLSSTSVAWVDAGGVRPLPEGTPPPAGRVGSLRVLRSPASATLRIPVSTRVPFRVEEEERRLIVTLYGVQGDMDWIHYGEADSLIELVRFSQRTAEELDITVELGEPVWGYRARWIDNQLLLEIRRPPEIDRRRPLAGRRIALDPGHPPLGATGPTGVREPDVTLAVARIARDLLLGERAEVILLRDSDAPVSLDARTTTAERENAELLVSIHANALPDGVNPFVNNGTSVYYFHPRAIELARAINRELVKRFGFRDLGVGRGDLALARPTWMPAVLVEGLFLMIPEQEAVLASPEGQRRYAEGIVEGLKAFLRRRSQAKD